MSGSNEFDNPKRWQPSAKGGLEAGRSSSGITDPQMLLLYGRIVSEWTHIEEVMVEVVNKLVFVDHDLRRAAAEKTRGYMPGRQIFRSIGANGVRVKLMKNLLGKFIGNLKKDPLYDEIIVEFQNLVNLRNDYVHGLWWTHESGRVYLQTENVIDYAFGPRREIKIEEFAAFITKATALRDSINKLALIEYQTSDAKRVAEERHAASLGKPLVQHPSDTPTESDPPANNQQDT